MRFNLHCQPDTLDPLGSDSINILLPNILGGQEAGEAMTERTLPTNIQLPTSWLPPPPAPGSKGGEKGVIKEAFVFYARNLISRKKGGQSGRRHVYRVLMIQSELLSRLGPLAKQAGSLSHFAL